MIDNWNDTICGCPGQDRKYKCFTQRFTRLLFVINGYFDDINMRVSDHIIFSTVILKIKAGYSEAEFKDWIDAISE